MYYKTQISSQHQISPHIQKSSQCRNKNRHQQGSQCMSLQWHGKLSAMKHQPSLISGLPFPNLQKTCPILGPHAALVQVFIAGSHPSPIVIFLKMTLIQSQTSVARGKSVKACYDIPFGLCTILLLMS